MTESDYSNQPLVVGTKPQDQDPRGGGYLSPHHDKSSMPYGASYATPMRPMNVVPMDGCGSTVLAMHPNHHHIHPGNDPLPPSNEPNHPFHRTLLGVVSDPEQCVLLSLTTLMLSSLGTVFVCLSEIQMKNEAMNPRSSPSTILLLVLLALVTLLSIFGFNRRSGVGTVLLNYLWAILGLMLLSFTMALTFQFVWDLNVIWPTRIVLGRIDAPGLLSERTYNWLYQGSLDGTWTAIFPWWTYLMDEVNNDIIKVFPALAKVVPPMFRFPTTFWTPFGRESNLMMPPTVDQMVITGLFAFLSVANFFATRPINPLLDTQFRNDNIITRIKNLCRKAIFGPRVIRLLSFIIFTFACSLIMIDHMGTDIVSHTITYCHDGPYMDPEHSCYREDTQEFDEAYWNFEHETTDQLITPYLEQLGLVAEKGYTNLGVPKLLDQVAGTGRRLETVSERDSYQVRFDSPWILSSMSEVWAWLMSARLLLIVASGMTLIKSVQGSIASYIIISLAMTMNLLAILASFPSVLNKMLGPITTSLLDIPADGADVLPFPLNIPFDTPLTDQELSVLRRLSAASYEKMETLTVSPFARIRGRALPGLLHCVKQATELIRAARKQGTLPDISQEQVIDYCSGDSSTSRWRALGGATMLVTSFIPFVMLLVLLIANTNLSPTTIPYKAREDDPPLEKSMLSPSTDGDDRWIQHYPRSMMMHDEAAFLPAHMIPMVDDSQTYPQYLPLQNSNRHSPTLAMHKKMHGDMALDYGIQNGDGLNYNNARFFANPGASNHMGLQGTNVTGSNRYCANTFQTTRGLASSPHTHHPLFANANSNSFARNGIPRPLLRGYTPSLTPRATPPYSTTNQIPVQPLDSDASSHGPVE